MDLARMGLAATAWAMARQEIVRATPEVRAKCREDLAAALRAAGVGRAVAAQCAGLLAGDPGLDE